MLLVPISCWNLRSLLSGLCLEAEAPLFERVSRVQDRTCQPTMKKILKIQDSTSNNLGVQENLITKYGNLSDLRMWFSGHRDWTSSKFGFRWTYNLITEFLGQWLFCSQYWWNGGVDHQTWWIHVWVRLYVYVYIYIRMYAWNKSQSHV